MTAAFDISRFRSEINTNGVLPMNRFICRFVIPETLKKRNFFTEEFLTLRCETVTIPGQNFFTQDLKPYGYGFIEKKPYLPTFNPMRMVFIVDQKAQVINFFNQWANAMVNHKYDSRDRTGTYLVSYKSEYICPVLEIYVYDQENNKTFTTRIFDCYPLTISDFDTVWSAENSIVQLSVTLQFLHMSKEFSDGNNLPDLPPATTPPPTN